MVRIFTVLGFLAAILTLGPSAVAEDGQTFPTRPIMLIVPFAPGGVNDLLARLTVDKMSSELKRPIVVENRAGAGGRVAAQMAARAKPDGYTMMLITSGSTVVVGAFDPNLPYDPIKDFIPLAKIADFPIGIFGRKDLPANNLSELIAFAKTAPGGLKIGTSGNGSAGHLAAELLMSRAGVSAKFVHYRGEAQSMLAVMAGEIDIAFAVTSPDPTIKVLATTASERWSAYPDVPTVAEQGFKDYHAAGWAGLAVPAATPPDIVAKLEAAAQRVLSTEELKTAIRRRSAEPSSLTGTAFHDQMISELAGWKKLMIDANLKPFE